jgi:hypothetical protein
MCSPSSENFKTRGEDNHFESLLPFPAWGTGNVSPFFNISLHFYPVILNFFPNKLYFYFHILPEFFSPDARTKVDISAELSGNEAEVTQPIVSHL